MHVAEPDIDQRLQLLAHSGHVFEHCERIFNGQVEHVGDGVSLELHRQSFLVVAAAVAHFALHVDVGHEIHFNAALAVALAGLATSAGDIEAESPGLVAALARFREHGEEIADWRKHLRIGGGIGARRAADGRLVNAHHLVQLFCAGQRLVCAGLLARTVDALRQRAIENVVDERAFAAAAHAGNHGHDAKRNANGDVLQVVFASAGYGNPLASECARLGALQH